MQNCTLFAYNYFMGVGIYGSLNDVFSPLWETHIVEGSLVPELGPLPPTPTLRQDRLQVVRA